MNKKIITLLIAGALSVLSLAGCSGDATKSSGDDTSASSSATEGTTAAEVKTTAGEITVISREEGSGTRGAFVELLGIEEKNAEGKKVDRTTKEAQIASKTDVVLTQVASDALSIGYISLGSLNNTVKALKVDGVDATVDNIKSGSYKVSRPFNVAVKGEVDGLTKDFMNFIMSKEGQEVIVANKYIAVNDAAPAFTSDKSTGKIVIGGSSSVTPVMEKLVEAYKAINSGAEIEVQQTDSSSGMQAAIDGTCNIGMASRELKDSEKAELTATAIALDGIAVIVNKDNSFDDISSETIKSIYIGETTEWDNVK